MILYKLNPFKVNQVIGISNAPRQLFSVKKMHLLKWENMEIYVFGKKNLINIYGTIEINVFFSALYH